MIFLAEAQCAVRLIRLPHRMILLAYGRENISCTEKCSFAERLSRLASAIISAEASVASICAAAFTMCFAISPVPLASSSTVLASPPAGSAYTSPHTPPDPSHKAVVTTGILSQKVFRSFIAVALISSLFFAALCLSERIQSAAKFSRAGICPAALWRIPAVHCTPDKAPRPLSHARPNNTGAP